MNLSQASPIIQSVKPALELISLAGLSPEHARQSLRASLLLNPNYFANITANSIKAVLNIHKDTTFENIKCVVYDARSEQLQATVNINRCSGYSSESHKYGSEENVRFYLSVDGGATWKDHGLRTVNVFDQPGPKPVQFVVSVDVAPLQTHCFIEFRPQVRAILSWNAPPPENSPDWTPVWGSVRDVHLHFAESPTPEPDALLDQAERESPQEIAHSLHLEQCLDSALKDALRSADLSEPGGRPRGFLETDLMSSLFFPTILFSPPERPLTLPSQTGLRASLSPPVRNSGGLCLRSCRQLPRRPRQHHRQPILR